MCNLVFCFGYPAANLRSCKPIQLVLFILFPLIREKEIIEICMWKMHSRNFLTSHFLLLLCWMCLPNEVSTTFVSIFWTTKLIKEFSPILAQIADLKTSWVRRQLVQQQHTLADGVSSAEPSENNQSYTHTLVHCYLPSLFSSLLRICFWNLRVRALNMQLDDW